MSDLGRVVCLSVHCTAIQDADKLFAEERLRSYSGLPLQLAECYQLYAYVTTQQHNHQHRLVDFIICSGWIDFPIPACVATVTQKRSLAPPLPPASWEYVSEDWVPPLMHV